MVFAECDGITVPNPYGQLPLIDQYPTRSTEAYFTHVVSLIERAATAGLVIGLLPTWGDKVVDRMWGVGPEVFTPENARIYGEFLGQRYRGLPLSLTRWNGVTDNILLARQQHHGMGPLTVGFGYSLNHGKAWYSVILHLPEYQHTQVRWLCAAVSL